MQSSKVLLCQDILLEVLKHLAPVRRVHFLSRDDKEEVKKHRFECRDALVACATVSKVMSHQALNVLWEELDVLDPILQFLPGYRLRGQLEGANLQTMNAAVSTEAWSRLQSYATRVRGLTLSSSHHSRVHPTFWSFLARQCAGAPLLPHLRVLNAYFICDVHVAPLLLLLTPTLREVSLSLDELRFGEARLPDILGASLQNLALTAPHMKELNLLGNHYLDREHLLYLKCFTSIQTLCLSHQFHLNAAILQALSDIPTIRHLNVSVHLERWNGEGAPDFGDRFHGLRNLELSGTHKDVSDVFLAMSAPRLDLIALAFIDSLSTIQDSPFTAIAHIIPNTVTGLRCTFCAILECHFPSLVHLLGPLPPLLPKLASFQLTSEKSSLSVTNDDLARLGDAWPLLAHLNIRVSSIRSNFQTVRRPDVQGLVALAQRCRTLETLGLPELDVDKRSSIPVPGLDPDPGSSAAAKTVPFLDHRLKELFVQSVPECTMKAQHEAAVALDMLFPYLDLRTMRPGHRGAAVTGPWVTIWRTLEIMRWGRQNRALAEGGCDAAVPEVPDMPAEGGGAGRHGLGLPPLLPHHIPIPLQEMFDPPDWHANDTDSD